MNIVKDREIGGYFLQSVDQVLTKSLSVCLFTVTSGARILQKNTPYSTISAMLLGGLLPLAKFIRPGTDFVQALSLEEPLPQFFNLFGGQSRKDGVKRIKPFHHDLMGNRKGFEWS